MFPYGVQFYRPPNPPEGEREKDLEHIAKDLKFNTVKIWAMWAWTNPREGEFDFAELEEIMTICDRLGLKVVVNTILENAPYWLEKKYPDARYVNAYGQAISLGGNSNTPSGGHPGLCLNYPQVVKAAGDWLRRLARRLTKHPCFFLWDCWNEPVIEPVWATNYWSKVEGGNLLAGSTDLGNRMYCYCPATRKVFAKWLKDKYAGSLESLNSAWIRRFGSWDEVAPPVRHGTYADWLDWRRFMLDNMASCMQWRYNTLKAAAPGYQVMSHAGVIAPQDSVSELGIDGWKLAQPLDKWGISAFPRWQKVTPAQFAMRLELAVSSSRGKEIWVSELQGGQGMNSGLNGGPQVRARDIRLWNWLSAAYSARGILYWCYRAEATSVEATGYGLVQRNGEDTERSVEAARTGALLRKYEKIIREQKPKTDVAVLFDPDNAILNYAMEGDEKTTRNSYFGYYQAVWESDLSAEFIRPEDLMKTKASVLILPFPLIGKDEISAGIRKFVRNGGTIIAESSLGLFDKNGIHNGQRPFELADVFGAQEEDIYYVNQTEKGLEPIYYQPYLDVAVPVNTRLKANVFLTPLKVTSGRPIARYQKMTAGVYNRYGKGAAYYFGTGLGSSAYLGDKGAAEIIRHILASRCKPAFMGKKLRPRLMTGGREALLVVINDHRIRITETLPVPSFYREAVNLYTGKAVPVNSGKIKLTVESEDVAVLYFSRAT